MVELVHREIPVVITGHGFAVCRLFSDDSAYFLSTDCLGFNLSFSTLSILNSDCFSAEQLRQQIL